VSWGAGLFHFVVNMRLTLGLLLIALVHGAGDARNPAWIEPASPLDDLAHQVSVASGRARSSASDARAAGSEAAARSAGEQSVSSRYTAEHLAETTKLQEPFLKAAARESQKQKSLAAFGAKSAEDGYNTAVLMQKEAVKNAALFGTASTEKQLANTFEKLAEWKMETLHDLVSETKIAAQKAAAPYVSSLRVLHNRINEYEQRATQLNGQAFTLQNMASIQAAGAIGTMKKKQFQAAQQGMKDAHHMMQQAAVFGAQALKLMKTAQVLSLNFQAYQGAAEGAAATVAHRYAPQLYAPAPDAGTGWAPPGPPTPYTDGVTPAYSLTQQGSAHARKAKRGNPFGALKKK